MYRSVSTTRRRFAPSGCPSTAAIGDLLRVGELVNAQREKAKRESGKTDGAHAIEFQ